MSAENLVLDLPEVYSVSGLGYVNDLKAFKQELKKAAGPQRRLE